jgi:hypothetical protein
MTFGDPEAAVAAIVRDDPVVASLEPVVACTLIGYHEGDRWVLVTRTGGIPVQWMRKDNPRVKICAYAEDKTTANDLALAAREAVFAARGYEGFGLSLYDVTDEQGMTWDPDDRNPDIARYIFVLSLVTRKAGS